MRGVRPGAITTVDALAAALARWRNFDECLLVDVRLTEHLYAAEFVFDHIWGADGANGRVRPDLDDRQELVTIRMVGLERLRFDGALNDVQRHRPEEVNWGMSEVAFVRAAARDGLLGLDVSWEDDRRIEATFVSADVIEPAAKP